MSEKNRASTQDELSFIKDKELKRIIEDSIQYISLIFDNTKKSSNNLYKEETYRVIILYVISIIEAILLYILKRRREKITYVQYKFANPVQESFRHTELPYSTVVIAVQKEEVRDERKIGLTDLVAFMEKRHAIDETFATKILDANNIRNTFHFTKPRDKITCEIETVENALELLVDTIHKAPKAIVHKERQR